jgi:4-hydroxy-3-methylbut-2-enyl diphosphate reductase
MKINVTLARNAGFCFGVDRAVKIVYNILDEGKKPVMLGEIIHNDRVMSDLTAQGASVIRSLDGYERKEDEVIVIRAHGAVKSVYDKLAAEDIPFRDGTCPSVKRVQAIAEERSAGDGLVVIMGDGDHPEVEGIVSFCHNIPVICRDTDALYEFFGKNYTNIKKKVAIIAQTTYNVNAWGECVRRAGGFSPPADIYDTVCRATRERQSEALKLAAVSDLMFVVGGKNSSNTRRLYEICMSVRKRAVSVAGAEELDARLINDLLSGHIGDTFNIGITAGASVPAYIIKEVQNKMSDILQNTPQDTQQDAQNEEYEEFDFEEALDASFKRIYTGNRVKGVITAVNSAEAIVDVGTKHTGYVALDELTDDPNLKPSDIVKVGDEIDLIVVKINDAEGIIHLSKKKVDAAVGFNTVMKASADGAVLDGVVKDVIKGGLIVLSHGMKIFVPASLTGVSRDDSLEKMLKKNVRFKVIEFNEQRGKAVGSIKAVLGAEREAARAKFWETAAVGAAYRGEVKSLTGYGAFVDLGGIDGMVHVSELSWSRVRHPSEVLSVGDVVDVYIKELDKETNRVSLGYKKTEDNPWVKFAQDYSVGDVVSVKIVSLMPFGAFAEIIKGIDGLIHISQLSVKKVANVKDVLAVGDEKEVKITEIDVDKKRVSLSIKALTEESAADILAESVSPPDGAERDKEAEEGKEAEQSAGRDNEETERTQQESGKSESGDAAPAEETSLTDASGDEDGGLRVEPS